MTKITSLNRIIFMGTPEFALKTLQRLALSRFKPILVVTQPDKAKGRNRKTGPTPVKLLASDLKIEVFQPLSLKDKTAVSKLERLEPDLIVTVAYGAILGKSILKIPRYGCINLHPSLLPKYRGAAPINFALFNGDRITGNTLFQMAAKMDSGPILKQATMPIKEGDNYTSLADKLSEQGAELVLSVLEDFENNRVNPEPQKEEEATYCRKITKEDSYIDWNKRAEDIYNQVRALSLSPGAVTLFRDKRIKIIETEIVKAEQPSAAGKILNVLKGEGILVGTKDDYLLLTKVQPAGKRVMTAWEFSLGAKVKDHDYFTSLSEEQSN